MNYRRSTDRSTDKKVFRTTVDQTHKMNTRKPIKRGGVRL